MATVRIHRQSCELGRLPPVCICCGGPATHRPRHCFYFRRPPTGEPRFAQWITGAVAGLAAVIGPGARCFMPWVPASRWRASVQFPVPLCDAHHRRLAWPDYFLWGLLVLLVITAAVLVPGVFSIFRSDADDVEERIRTLETALSASVATAAVLIALRVVLWLTTVRVTGATPNFIDMAAVDTDFVDVLRHTTTATLPGYSGQSMGVPLSASAGMKQVGAVSVALLVLISGCVLLGYVGRASTIGMFVQHAGRLHAHAKSLHKKVVAEAQKRLADPDPSETENKAEEKSDKVEAPPSTAPAEELFTRVQTSPFEEELAKLSASGTEPSASTAPAPPRVEEFKVFGRERFPPHSREIRDTSQLQVGMEVWASAGRTWYRSTVVRVDSRGVARVRFPASTKLPERPLPAASIRLPAEGDGSSARDGGEQ